MIRAIHPGPGRWIIGGGSAGHPPILYTNPARPVSKRQAKRERLKAKAARRRAGKRRRFELGAIKHALKMVKAGIVPRPVPRVIGGNRKKRRSVMRALSVMVNS